MSMLLEREALRFFGRLKLPETSCVDSIDSFLQVHIEDDQAMANSINAACRDLADAPHCCEPSKALALRRFCYSFVFDSDIVESAQRSANSTFLSTCANCLSAYSACRDTVVFLCRKTFDEDGVEALTSAIQAFDRARFNNNFQAFLAGQATGEPVPESVIRSWVWELWLNTFHWLTAVGSEEALGLQLSELTPVILEQTWKLWANSPSDVAPRVLIKLFSADEAIRCIAIQYVTDLTRVEASLKSTSALLSSSCFDEICNSTCLAITSGILSADERDDQSIVTPLDLQRILMAVAKVFARDLLGASRQTDSGWMQALQKFVGCVAKFTRNTLDSGWPNNVFEMNPGLPFALTRFLASNMCDPRILSIRDGDSSILTSIAELAFDFLRRLLAYIENKSFGSDATACSLAIGVFHLMCSFTTHLASLDLPWEVNVAEMLNQILRKIQGVIVFFPTPYLKVDTVWNDGSEMIDLMPSHLVAQPDKTLPLSHFRSHLQLTFLTTLRLETVFIGRNPRSRNFISLLLDPSSRESAMAACVSAFCDTMDEKVPTSAPRKAMCFEAFRDIVFWLFFSFNDDLIIWQYLLSSFMSAKFGLVLPLNVKRESPFAPPKKVVVSQIAVPKVSRPVLFLPLSDSNVPIDDSGEKTNTSALLGFVSSSLSSETAPPFAASFAMKRAFPFLLLKAHHQSDFCESLMESMLINLTEFALLPAFHSRMLLFYKRAGESRKWVMEDSSLLDCQMACLVGYESEIMEALDLIYGAIAFTCRYMMERLKLWAIHQGEAGSLVAPAKPLPELPVLECSLCETPISFAEISKISRPVLSETEKSVVSRSFQAGSMSSSEFSTAIMQLGVLAFPLATAGWPVDVKREISALLSLLCSNSTTHFMSSTRCVNASVSLMPPVGTPLDTDLLKFLGTIIVSTLKMPDDASCVLQGIDICFEQQQQSLQMAFACCPASTRVPAECYVEQLMLPAICAKSAFWFLRGVLSTLEMVVEEFALTGRLSSDETLSASLSSMETSIWNLFILCLKFGPPAATVAFKDDNATLTADAFALDDVYHCFFASFDKFIQHVTKQLISSASSQGGNSWQPVEVHLAFIQQSSTWSEYLARWGRAAQTLAISQLTGKGHQPLNKAEENWSTQTDLGQAVRESCINLANLFKAVKNHYPDARRPLPRELFNLAVGKPLAAPLPPSTTETIKPPLKAATTNKNGFIDLESTTEDEFAAAEVSSATSLTAKSKPPQTEAKLSKKPSPQASDVDSSISKASKLQQGMKGNLMNRAKGRESLISKLYPSSIHKSMAPAGGGAHEISELPPRSFDVGLELKSNWSKQDFSMGGKKPLAVKAATVRSGIAMPWNEYPSKLGDDANKPKSAILLENRKTGPMNDIAKPNTPQLKKLSAEEKQLAISRAGVGVQMMLQQILEWDFANLDKYELPELQHLPDRLPLTFDNADAFREYFKPLVLEECRCAILQERVEKKLEGCAIVISKATVSAHWMLATAKCGRRKRQVVGGNEPQAAAGQDYGISPERAIINAPHQELEILPLKKHDLVMLVPIPSILNTKNMYDGRSMAELNCAPQEGYFMAVVEKTDSSEERFDPADLTQCRLRFPRSLPSGVTQSSRLPASSVTIASAWLAFPIASLTTSVREFQSLFTACFSPVFDFILKPHAFGVKRRNKDARPSQGGVDSFKHRLEQKKVPEGLHLPSLSTTCNMNPSQTAAIKHALTADFGVALLQGPPGTGKTKTLLAIIAAIFSINGAGNVKGAAEGTSYLNKKVLVCAPSNAAVDEIAARILKEGIPKVTSNRDASPEVLRPTCLRVGNPNRITRDEVRSISLEERLSNENQNIKEKKLDSMKEELGKISLRLDAIEDELKAHSLAAECGVDSGDLIMGGTATTRSNAPAYAELMSERRTLLQSRKKIKESFQGDVKQSKSRTKDGHLKGTDLFFATLSGSASDLLTSVEFEYVIVDEAAQAVELSGLIPLRHDVSKLILIGDPQQLPATVLSASAKKFNYERSLFQRLQLTGVDVVMLSTQYRMRPEISAFPSLHFYQGKLQNDSSVISRAPLSFHMEWKSLFGPFKFFDIQSTESRHALSQSLCNKDEAGFILQLLLMLLKYYVPKINSAESNGKSLRLEDIAIVTPYKQQVLELQKLLRAQRQPFDAVSAQPLEVCTIDSFQGREKKIIIFSCVRSLATAGLDADSWENSDDDDDDEATASSSMRDGRQTSKQQQLGKTAGIGFVADIRRLNVAITRARDALWIVGNSKTLKKHETWNALIKHAKKGNCGTLSVPNPPSVDGFTSIDAAEFLNVRRTVETLQTDQGLANGSMRMARPAFLHSPLLASFFNLLEKRFLKYREASASRSSPNNPPKRKAPGVVESLLVSGGPNDISAVSSSKANVDVHPQPPAKMARTWPANGVLPVAHEVNQSPPQIPQQFSSTMHPHRNPPPQPPAVHHHPIASSTQVLPSHSQFLSPGGQYAPTGQLLSAGGHVGGRPQTTVHHFPPPGHHHQMSTTGHNQQTSLHHPSAGHMPAPPGQFVHSPSNPGGHYQTVQRVIQVHPQYSQQQRAPAQQNQFLPMQNQQHQQAAPLRFAHEQPPHFITMQWGTSTQQQQQHPTPPPWPQPRNHQWEASHAHHQISAFPNTDMPPPQAQHMSPPQAQHMSHPR